MHSLLEIGGVVFQTSLFLLAPVTSTVICLLLFYSLLWPCLVIYLAWMIIFDWNVCMTGGRRPQKDFWLRGPMTRACRDYFNAKLIKTADLDPDYNYLVGHHPHGVVSIGINMNYGTCITGIDEKFPGIKPCVAALDLNFRLPFAREYPLSYPLISVAEKSIVYVCKKMGAGNLVAIAVGGAEAAFDTFPGSNKVTIKKRKGIFRLAMQTGARLVPSYSFGEHGMYKQIRGEPGSVLSKIQHFFKRLFGVSPVLFYGRFLWVPFRTKLTTVVGAPIDVPKIEKPTKEDIDKCRELYISGLRDIFDKYKGQYNINPNAELEVN